MPVHDDLGLRMKENYEQRSRTYLMRRTPVVIRIDGKAFHTFTKGFQKPFDDLLIDCMQETMKYLCENIQGCVLGYTQSDEITLILQDYKSLTTDAWFDYQVQKICSISASMATMIFNKIFTEKVNQEELTAKLLRQELSETEEAHILASRRGAMFDARCFNIPPEEVTNLIYWRQLDATKNSIQMLARAYFSDAELHGKNTSEMQEMLWATHKINWNGLPITKKRGSCCIKKQFPQVDETEGQLTIRTRWEIDNNIPIFVNSGRNYVEEQICFPTSD